MTDLRPDFRYRPVDIPNKEEQGDTIFLGNLPHRRFGPVVGAIAIVLAFSIIVIYAYRQGTKDGALNSANVPIVRADNTPFKMRPEEPGGQDVPYQEMLVMNGGEAAEAGQEIVLLPDSEMPLPRPTLTESRADGQSTGPKVISLTNVAPTPVEAEIAPAAGTEPAQDTVTAAPQPKPSQVAEVETPIETASIAKTSGTWRVQLGSFREKGAADSAWTKLQREFPSLLEGLAHESVRADLGTKGIYYRVQATSLSKTSAEQICTAMNSKRSGSCLVVKGQ